MQNLRNNKAFTLIELLIVIAVMAILTTVVFVALNPLERFQDSRNSRRWSDINAIIGAIKLYQVDNGGALPGELSDENFLPDVYYEITEGAGLGDGSCASADKCIAPNVEIEDCIDLEPLVTSGKLPKMPFDPNDANSTSEIITGYYVIMSGSNGALTIGSCYEEKGSKDSISEISVTR